MRPVFSPSAFNNNNGSLTGRRAFSISRGRSGQHLRFVQHIPGTRGEQIDGHLVVTTAGFGYTESEARTHHNMEVGIKGELFRWRIDWRVFQTKTNASCTPGGSA
jgi:hypothetical protein